MLPEPNYSKQLDDIFTKYSDKPVRQSAVKKEKPKLVLKETGLYNIFKRSADGNLNKCIGIGFTKEEGENWVANKLKVKETCDSVIFYDLIPEGKLEAESPYWNDNSWILGIKSLLTDDKSVIK